MSFKEPTEFRTVVLLTGTMSYSRKIVSNQPTEKAFRKGPRRSGASFQLS